jgi:uncharacterized membrane protein (UPF0182 family)
MSQVASAARRRWLFLAVGLVILVGIVLSGLSGFYVDLLWFREVGFSGVFWSVFWSKVILGLIFAVFFFVLLAANLFMVRRLSPRYRPFSPEQEVIDRYRVAFDPYARLLVPAFSALIALLVGIAASAQWESFIVWRSAGSVGFGPDFLDPVFGRDPGFYVFILPFHKWVQGWLFSAFVGVTVITAAAHYLTGGIRLQTVGEKVTPQVKAHLSVLLGVIVLIKAWGYYLGRFDLLVSSRGVVTGASYTDVHAQLPALTVLVFIAIACSILFVANIRFRGWALPVIGVGLLALTSIVAGAIVPAVVQRLSVAPQELQREAPYIDRNIEATREALGLDRIELQQTTTGGEVTALQVEANQPTIDNVRLWDPAIIQETYENLQRIQPYYEFHDVDVDRYVIDGLNRVVMISPREVSQNGIPPRGRTWQNQAIYYTHGYGAVASPVNVVTSEGRPVFALADIPPPTSADIELDPGIGAQIYYGERTDVPYVLVGAEGADELNYPASGAQRVVETRYAGKGGISMGSLFRRALFAYRFRDVNLMISGLIGGDSRILINRDVQTRIRKAAPFLVYDADPYSAIIDGRLVYIQDAYTATDVYPYSEEVDLNEATGGDLVGRVNYMRNSVKAVMDAYDGTVTFYVVDPDDPLIQVWQRAFPELFTTQAAPLELQEHFRYPENLLQIQATQYANYHVTDSRTFYSRENFWELPNNPTAQGEAAQKTRPYYVLLKLPGETEEEFVLFTPFTPFQRQNMIAYLAAKSDPESYGALAAFEFPSGNPPDGPQQIFARINQDADFARERTLLGQAGSQILFGNLFIVPIENSFLYVQPVFVRSAQENSIPELKRVVLVNGETVSMGDTLAEALAISLGAAPPPPPGEEQPPPEGDVAALLAEALQHFEAAQDALTRGDLAGYQREIELAQDLIEQANELAGGGAPAPGPSPSPTPSPSPSP